MPRSECINVSPRANDEGCGASGWQDRLLACSTHSGRFSEIDEVYGEESDIPCSRPCLVSGHIGALSSFRERGEMSPHKRAIRHLAVKSACRQLDVEHGYCGSTIRKAGYTLKWFWLRRGADYLDSSMSALPCRRQL